MKHKNKYKYQEGQLLIFTFVMMAVITLIIVALVGYAGTQLRSQRQAVNRTIGLDIAEAGAEMAIWKLNNQVGYIGESNTSYGGGVYSVTVTTVTGNSKLIKVDSYVPNAVNPIAHRTIQVTATLGTTNIGFNYGVHVGNGGLDMSNNSRIVGNVYANGNITGSQSARIQGTAIVAGNSGIIDGMDIDGDSWSHTIRGNSTVGGNAKHSVLQNTTVTGNVVSDSISNCTIAGTAKYDTRSSCSVSGATTTPNPDAFVGAPNLPLPITEEQIDEWEAEATAGGTIASQTYDSGTRNLGPIKINGNLTVTGTAELVVTGTIWVTGQITINNSAIIRLASGYGTLSGIIIAGIDESTTAGYIDIDNSSQVLGSGETGSYVLLLSQREGTANTAIKQNNGSGAAILYAGEGTIEIGNNSSMKEITAALLKVTNAATIAYETGLANANFTSGPAGGWEIQAQTWQMLQ